MSDRDLLDPLRRGDQSAFSTIFRSYYAALVSVADRMVRDHAVAEELAQDVFLELWRRRETLVVEDSLRAYLFRAARNRALNHLRHLRVEKEGEPLAASPPSSPPTAITNLLDSEIEGAVRVAVSELPERCREVFELSRVHGLKYAEIADTLGISVKGVEAHMGKALRLLRESLASWL